jgi:hypothetical protein
VYQFPFLAGVTALAWLIPQAVSLTEFIFIPEEAVTRMLLMAVLCMAMIYVGYVWPKQPLQSLNWTLDERRLLYASCALIIVGGVFYGMLYQLPESRSGGQMWSGLAVAYLFFASLANYGFALAALIYARTRSTPALWIALGGSIFYLEKIFFGVRRSGIAEFILIIALAAWFGRRKAVPRSVMVAGLLVGMLLVNVNIGELRNAARDGLTVEDLQEIEWAQNFSGMMDTNRELGTGTELEAGAYRMEIVAESGAYDLGVFHWNRLVFNYVPAQLVGQSVKQAFYVGTYAPSDVQGAYERFGYTRHTGLTSTGMTDAFSSFWYFGALKFFVVAFIMSKLYMAAVRGHFVAQLLCMILTVPAMHIVTHSTHWFFQNWPHMLVFLGGVLWYARERPTPHPAQSPASVQTPYV